MQQIQPSQASPEVPINENFETLSHMAVYGLRQPATSGLVWGYYGGRWGGIAVVDGTLTLPASSTVYLSVDRTSGAIAASASTSAWNDSDGYARAYKLTTGTATVTAVEDFRSGPGGVHGQGGGGSGPGTVTQALVIACGDETSALTTGSAKVTFRMPYAMTLTEVRASVTSAPAGSGITVDINLAGASILSPKLTIDAGGETSTAATVPAMISTSSLPDDAKITIDVDSVGSGAAGAGLKVALIGVVS